jgi:formiminotetrahydrofolate cyclodeaminase
MHFKEGDLTLQKDIIIEKYISELSSSSPTPGGGSAAALAATLSSALTAMVFNLTVGKKDYNKLDILEKELIDNALENSKKCNKKLLEFMDKDSEAFLGFMNTFKLPNETEEDMIFRENEIQKGYISALQIPLDLAEECVKFYEFIILACKYGNKNVISDAGVASILLFASIESSILNVKINLAGLKDEDYKIKVENRCYELLKTASTNKIHIMEIVNSVIG